MAEEDKGLTTFVAATADTELVTIRPDGKKEIMIGDKPMTIMGFNEASPWEALFEAVLIQPAHVTNRPQWEKKEGSYFVGMISNKTPIVTLGFLEELVLLPICILREGRSRFPKFDGEGENKPDCYSTDGVCPNAKVEAPYSAACTGWYTDAKDGKKKYGVLCDEAKFPPEGGAPRCREYAEVAFLAILGDRAFPVKYNFHGKSISVWKKFVRSYQTYSNAAEILGESIFSYVIKARAVRSKKGPYYEMTLDFAKDEKIDGTLYLPLAQFYCNALKNRSRPEDQDYSGEDGSADLEGATLDGSADLDAQIANAVGEDFDV
ncbi:MAG: hypothetical protein LHW56_01795 [Candidatus Cloacimonetes bacterium]|nr:hypothetical protein [Candidatus Cloacimonadota bacterium]MDY0171620.1 hypothetical protein [Candidatus Cloacimonadaceae bacterium]